MLYLVLEIGVAPRCKCVQKGGNITIAPARGTIRSDWYGNSVKPPSSTFLKVNNKCTSGGSHDPVCDSCIAAICAGQPSCCDTLWDVSCIEAARTVCGSLTCAESAGSCPHGLCAEGVALTPYCDVPPSAASCVESVCQEAPDCCLVAWDAACIGLIDTACGLNCD